ncbi:MAG: VWA domain-containing protein [Ruminococcus sp.]|nr:VWA domain-containing protein [Ruminococcus sp.]
MRKGLTEIVFIIDESGSMFSLKADTIGGFNSVLSEQRGKEGEALVSTVLFNTNTRVLHDRVSIGEVPDMTADDYRPNGCTALLDAVGGAIRHIGNIHKYARKDDVPEHTLFVITTDGLENSSRKYSASKVRSMISRQQEKYGWEFIFLGANIDSVETARSFGIDESRAVNYNADRKGTSVMYEAVCAAVSEVRSSRGLGSKNMSWREQADEDFNNR